jgi:hypothetical protein
VTKRETIEAFVRGDIDRRAFVGRLTALGVSSGAALAYANSVGSVAAAPATNSAGYVVQTAQDDDQEYGLPIIIETLEEALEIVLGAIQGVLDLLEGLGNFTAEDFDEGVFEYLTTIQEQQGLHAEALGALSSVGSAGSVRAFSQTGRSSSLQGTGDAAAFLTSLTGELESLSATYAAVVPAVDDGEARQTMTNTASVSNRHVASTHLFAGSNPFPEAFQTRIELD